MKVYNEDEQEEEAAESGIYDELTNSILFNGVIVDDEMVDTVTQYWGSAVGFISPSMIRDALKEVEPGYALEINSPGGDVYAGVEIVSTLRKNPPETTIVTGIAASMAAMIALIPEERYAGSELAAVMFHAPWGCFCGNASEIESIAEDLRKTEGAFKSFIENNIKASGAKKINKAIDSGDDMLLSVDECVELGVLRGVIAHSNEGTEGAEDDESEVLSGNAMPRWQQMELFAARLKFQTNKEQVK